MVAFPLLAVLARKVRPATRRVLLVLTGSLGTVLTALFLIGVVHPMWPPIVPCATDSAELSSGGRWTGPHAVYVASAMRASKTAPIGFSVLRRSR